MKIEALNKLSSPVLMADMSSCNSEVEAKAFLPLKLESDDESDSLEDRSYSERCVSIPTVEGFVTLFWRFPRAISVAL